MATLDNITHDGGPPLSNYWTTITDPGGRGSVTVAAALNGTTQGLQIDYDATNDLVLEDPFVSPASGELRFRFYFDPNGVASPTVASEKWLLRAELNNGSPFGAHAAQIIIRKRQDSILRVTFSFNDDLGQNDAGDFDITDDVHCFEMAIKRASSDVASDGDVSFWIDEVRRDDGAGDNIDNFDVFPTIDTTYVFSEDLEAAMLGAVLYADEFRLDDVEATSLCAGGLGLAAMTKPASLSADGDFIYVALLEGGTPILTKISTLLNADGTTVFDPGAGDNIGVECGRFDANVVWVAGNFDGTNVIEKSEDAGSSFTVKDDTTIGDVRSFIMGSDSDDRLLVFDETNGDILETINSGETWTSINAAVTPEVNAIARLGENVQESVFGNNGAANNSINYSVNSGDDLEDYQTGVYPNANATGVIVN